MNESERLNELASYKILDSDSELEFDEITEIASAICNTPISLISFVDEKRQWFKSSVGLTVKETPRELSFCQHALSNPKEVLIVDDPQNDIRFKDNPLVHGDSNIRFYAGAPLETPSGNVLGTLCVVDNKPRKIEKHQIRALQILAEKVVQYLEIRKVLLHQRNQLELSASQLKKVTNLAPGALFQAEQSPEGLLTFSFISEGLTKISPDLDIAELKKDTTLMFEAIHPYDVDRFKEKLQASFRQRVPLDIEYRILTKQKEVLWLKTRAVPEEQTDSAVIWYGTIQDITETKEYTQVLEKILFDISHIARRPVASMLGLVGNIDIEKLDERMIREYARHLRLVATEMDTYLTELNRKYSAIRSTVTEPVSQEK
ncbi:MAG: GAF domain-containing protein [Bacteroidota bacterium]